MVTATLTKVLHCYGGLEIQESMRFANLASAKAFKRDVLNRRVSNPMAGSPYTITAVSF
jgi:hypothetical protein